MKKITNFAAILMVSAMLHSQTTIYVKPAGTGDGTSWANAGNLENAAKTAVSGNEIWVQRGTYYPSKMLVIPASVKIYGGFAGTETALSQRDVLNNFTILDAQEKFGSVVRLSAAAELNGFTIQNGNANGNSQKNGGGVWADENCVIENCKIINNTAMFNGGGVYAKGEIKIVNSTVENNTAFGTGKNMFGNCQTIVTHKDNLPVIAFGCNTNTPGWGTNLGTVSFATNTTWTVEQQIWSDAVTTTGCNKTTFNGGVDGNVNADCRNNPGQKGSMFSSCAVKRYGAELCPAPWRVPSQQDFCELDRALGGPPECADLDTKYNDAVRRDKYLNIWGGCYGGACEKDGSLYNQNSSGYYVSQWTSLNLQYSFGLIYRSVSNNHEIKPQGYFTRSYGVSLRCVRDK